MKNNFHPSSKKLIFFLVFVKVSLFSSFNLLAVTIIDFDKFNFPHINQRGVRAVSFNVEEQEYEKITYFVIETSKSNKFKETFEGLTIDADCNVLVPKKFPLKGYMIRSAGKIDFGKVLAEETKDFTDKGAVIDRALLRHKKAETKTGKHIMKVLNKTNNKNSHGNAFEVKFIKSSSCYKSPSSEKKYFNNLSSATKDNNDERGIIGELATHLTMLTFKYNSLYGKYETNHGFDGVFEDSSKSPELFISESKCREQAATATSILSKNLGESNIYTKLLKMSNGDHKKLSSSAKKNLKNTGKLIRKYIENSPEKIFKFAHRIRPDGTCQSCIEPFNLNAWNSILSSKICPKSPEGDKLLVLDNMMEQICSSTNEKVMLLLKSMTPSERKIMAKKLNSTAKKKLSSSSSDASSSSSSNSSSTSSNDSSSSSSSDSD